MKRINVFEFYTNLEMLSEEVRGGFIALIQQAIKEGYLAVLLKGIVKSDGNYDFTFIFQDAKFLFAMLDQARIDLKQRRVKIAKKVLVDLFIDNLTEARNWLIAASEFLDKSCYDLKLNIPVKIAAANDHNLHLSCFSPKEKQIIFANLRQKFTVETPFFGGLLSRPKRLPINNFVIYNIERWERRLDIIYKNNSFIFFTGKGIIFDK